MKIKLLYTVLFSFFILLSCERDNIEIRQYGENVRIKEIISDDNEYGIRKTMYNYENDLLSEVQLCNKLNDGSWSVYKKALFTYEQDLVTVEFIERDYNRSDTGEFMTYMKWIYAFDGELAISKIEDHSLKWGENDLTVYEKYECTYDSDNNLYSYLLHQYGFTSVKDYHSTDSAVRKKASDNNEYWLYYTGSDDPRDSTFYEYSGDNIISLSYYSICNKGMCFIYKSEFLYDNNLITKQQFYDLNDNDEPEQDGYINYTYDSNQNLIERKNGSGDILKYFYEDGGGNASKLWNTIDIDFKRVDTFFRIPVFYM